VANAGHGHRSGGGRRAGGGAAHRYPRTARVNEILRQVLADAVERLADNDERLALLTITGVDCDTDLRRALVLFSSLGEDGEAALGEARVRLQAAISQQVRLKRTPQLRFGPDPAVAAGTRIEDILRELPDLREDPEGGSGVEGGGGAEESAGAQDRTLPGTKAPDR
jgi:ribosome-binding factor A